MTMWPNKSPEPSEGQPAFFAVSPLKLVVMSTVTFGIYELFWFYKNWKLVKQRTERDIMPFWRAFFGVLFCYSFFCEVQDESSSRGISFPSHPALLAACWIFLAVMWRLPDPYWLICLLSPLVLVPVQNTINRVNAVVAPNHDRNSRFSGWNIASVVIGVILFACSIIYTFLPQ
jgi:hypothetical protein